MNITYQKIREAYASKGYQFFDSIKDTSSGEIIKPYNLNIWGIRKQFGELNLFDDVLGVCYNDEEDVQYCIFHNATVDPGKYYMLTKLGNPDGTFILAPGQYKSCWEKGKHKNKYVALRQKDGYLLFNGWRDNLLDGVLQRKVNDDGDFYHDVAGLNMHRSGENLSQLVGGHSAGCQVRQINEEHKSIMNIIDKALNYFTNSFTYTLFDEEEVFSENAERRGDNGKVIKLKKWPDDYITKS